MRVLISPDKFKGTASADEVAAAMAAAVTARSWTTELIPMADGGEGTLDALGGPNRTSTVTGPLGTPVEAAWRLGDGVAVVEAARCAGLVLAGGAAGNRPLEATTRGVGELIAEAVALGARRLLVTVGGVATTDGGRGALDAVGDLPPGVDLQVACDVATLFVDAAAVFGPQKGATPGDVAVLTRRLQDLRAEYLRTTGRDVGGLPGSGAAGGLAGGLAALGARLVPGVDMVADALGIDAALARADLVLTGEGRLDAQSFEGKVVGGVDGRARRAGIPCLAVVGVADPGVARLPVVSLVEACGLDRALHDTRAAITEATGLLLAGV
ncbi:glycerate kinase family protein [Cellulomonas aerilata]|uniref:Glycerate kinase n=1 Tax=Cellulomonas aerilata TaxID=515326 RepID=A0A512D7E9_9CELL|nr:glycerate kinase [Cellulomonas aerilata]GEO32317.1 glycerate kinase [Cellulomonas aerilata]